MGDELGPALCSVCIHPNNLRGKHNNQLPPCWENKDPDLIKNRLFYRLFHPHLPHRSKLTHYNLKRLTSLPDSSSGSSPLSVSRPQITK